MSYGPPPGPFPPPPPGAAPRRSWRPLIIVIVVVLLLCCGGVITGGFFVVRGFLDATAPPREAAHAFLADLQRRDHSAAYDQLCERARRQHSRDDFDQRVQQLGQVVDYRITGVSMNRNLVSTTGTVTVRLHLDDGDPLRHVFPLVREDDTWRVCGDPF